MEKDARIILAQVDHVSGEVIGFAIEKLMEMGAHNIQLIPTITKKNRPGNIMIIDTDERHEASIADFLSRELKVSGYHRIHTRHVFFMVTFAEKSLRLNINGKSRTLKCKFKIIGDPSDPISVDIEHDFVVEVQSVIESNSDTYISLNELRNIIEASFSDSSDEIEVEI
jgi:uncharacterized protein (DUF111 family)